MTIVDTIKERGRRYGDFKLVAEITQKLKIVVEEGLVKAGKPSRLPYTAQEAIDLLLGKIARAVSGDETYSDNPHDIAGYATLWEEALKGSALQEEAKVFKGSSSEFEEPTKEKIGICISYSHSLTATEAILSIETGNSLHLIRVTSKDAIDLSRILYSNVTIENKNLGWVVVDVKYTPTLTYPIVVTTDSSVSIDTPKGILALELDTPELVGMVAKVWTPTIKQSLYALTREVDGKLYLVGVTDEI